MSEDVSTRARETTALTTRERGRRGRKRSRSVRSWRDASKIPHGRPSEVRQKVTRGSTGDPPPSGREDAHYSTLLRGGTLPVPGARDRLVPETHHPAGWNPDGYGYPRLEGNHLPEVQAKHGQQDQSSRSSHPCSGWGLRMSSFGMSRKRGKLMKPIRAC